MMSTFRIADLSLGSSTTDGLYSFEYSGAQFEVQRFGANFSPSYLIHLITALRNQVDAIAVSDLFPPMQIRGRTYIHRQYLETMSTPCSIPLCDGLRIKEIANINSMAAAIQNQEIDPTQGIFFPTALLHLDIVHLLMDQYPEHLRFGDAFSWLGIPWAAHPSHLTATASRAILYLSTLREISATDPLFGDEVKKKFLPFMKRRLKNERYIYGDLASLLFYWRSLDIVRDKDVILGSSHPYLEQKLLEHAPRSLIRLFPPELRFDPQINYAVLDATLRLAHQKTAPLSLQEWEELLSHQIPIHRETRRFATGIQPSLQLSGSRVLHKMKKRFSSEPKIDFAFVIHALSVDDLYRVPGVQTLRHAPRWMSPWVEKSFSLLPGFPYGYIKNITSKKTNREINGLIYALPSTPRMLLEEPPEITYKKMETLCNHAAQAGAKIIGLGAYTKIVGDAGATIQRNSPIPVTTGNSLSASTTLWALYDAVEKLGLVKKSPETLRFDGSAMVIGATGSIGRVSAKLLSLAFKRLYLIAPRIHRLQEIADEIRLISPHCEVLVSTEANPFAHDVDALVTATSALDQKVVDVELLKPGCVVCDCSRPLDFSAEDARKRPDVLIIESGLVILPGPLEITCDLGGLPRNTVYGCLAETAILSLEEKYEPYSLGRDLDWIKVKEIYKLAQEHGAILSAARGPAGNLSKKEIEITRELALKKRAEKRPPYGIQLL